MYAIFYIYFTYWVSLKNLIYHTKNNNNNNNNLYYGTLRKSYRTLVLE